MKCTRIIDAIKLLSGDITLTQDFDNNCIMGKIGENQLYCFSKEYNPSKGKIDSDVTLKLDNVEMEFDNNCDGSVKQIVVENEDSIEQVYNDNSYVHYSNCYNEYKNEEIFFNFYDCDYTDKKKSYMEICLAAEMAQTMMLTPIYTNVPEFFDKSVLDALVSNGLIEKAKVDQLEQCGYVYSKYFGKNIEKIKNKFDEEPSCAVSYTAVYSQREDFEKHKKPILINVDIFTSSKKEYNSFHRYMYALNKEGIYQNINEIILQESIKEGDFRYKGAEKYYSPLEYDYMKEHLKELKLSVEPTNEFNTYYNMDNMTSYIQNNLNQIRLHIDQLKFENYIQKQIIEHREKLQKEFNIANSTKKTI